MRYLSTRGHADRKRFCEILLEGLAPDGGLYLPEYYPVVDAATLALITPLLPITIARVVASNGAGSSSA